MVVKPYTETHLGSNTRQRVFEHAVSSDELVWHRDRTNRTVTVTEGTDWKFQLDNCIPQTIKPGDVLHIPANTFHRIIMGSSRLVVEITEHEPTPSKQSI